MDIKDFRDLDVWKLGKAIVLDIYRVTGNFSKNEQFGLTSQMRRAAISVPSNIAEGYNRMHRKEYQRFLSFALGSCGELETQVEISYDLQYLDKDEKDRMLENLSHEARMIRNLIKKL